MLRILVLHPLEWRDRRAGENERYLHEVFRRIAAEGHYVAWVASVPRGVARQTGKTVVIVDGIQLAHLGWPLFYKPMARMLLPRLQGADGVPARFDVVVEGVNGKPLGLAETTSWPVTPIVFRVSRRLRASDDPPGPIIAADEAAARGLVGRGVPESFIVRAFFDADGGDWDRTARRVLATIENAATF